MPREICPKCNYIKQNCVCEYITPVKHQVALHVLQHPSEVKNAKNTVKLLTLVSNNTQVHIGEQETDFEQLKKLHETNPSEFGLLFPSNEANTISTQQLHIKHLILIDGTWKKAKKILHLNPWLKHIPHFTFAEDISSEYQIRTSSVKGSLSTIEAAAYSLNQFENCAIDPFLCALNGLKLSFTKRMPSQVKARYQQRE